MPKILFASNNITHWPTAVAGTVAGTFDSSRVPYAIAMTNYETLNSPEFTQSTTDDTWFHFRVYSSGDAKQYLDPTLFQAYGPTGNVLFNIKKVYNAVRYTTEITLYDGNTTSVVTSSINLTDGKVNAIDIQYIATALKLEVNFYVNGTLGATRVFNSNPNNYDHPTTFSLGCAFTVSVGDTQYVSEILVADGDTRNARLNLLRPSTGGAYGDWVGALTDLADDDPSTGMTTLTPDTRHTMGLTAYTGAQNISNFVIVSQTTRGLNAPTGLKHSVRITGVDYDSDLIPVDFGLQYNLTDFQINPGTSQPWVGSDLSTIETGFVSVA